MAVKDGWRRLETQIKKNTRVDTDFLEFCDLFGVDQATGVRMILVAWSEAKHGELGQLWGFNQTPIYPMYPAPAPQPQPVEQPAPKPEKKKPNAAKAALDSLDLDL